MSKLSKHATAEWAAVAIKVAGATILAVANHPVAAFSSLLTGSAMAAALAVATGNRAQLIVNSVFVGLNGLSIARVVGLWG